ncbi:MAG: suppressor of fused domain protein, partial [Polyangiaceae bacterium]|nr:suppressor of fused domain protein [Polyangiaceae bacterium]
TRSWLGFGHTVPNGEPPVPFADNTKLCCALLLPPVRVPSDFYDLRLEDGRAINIYAVVPIYAEELQLKLTRGVGDLLDRFDREGVNELLDRGRVNTCCAWLDMLSVN